MFVNPSWNGKDIFREYRRRKSLPLFLLLCGIFIPVFLVQFFLVSFPYSPTVISIFTSVTALHSHVIQFPCKFLPLCTISDDAESGSFPLSPSLSNAVGNCFISLHCKMIYCASASSHDRTDLAGFISSHHGIF